MSDKFSIYIDSEIIAKRFFETSPSRYPWSRDGEFPLIQAVEGNIRTVLCEILNAHFREIPDFHICCETRFKQSDAEPSVVFDIVILSNHKPILAIELKSKEASLNKIWKTEISKYCGKKQRGMQKPDFPIAFIALWWGIDPQSDKVPEGHRLHTSPGLFAKRPCHLLYVEDIRKNIWNE
jgi:hypothetical protein